MSARVRRQASRKRRRTTWRSPVTPPRAEARRHSPSPAACRRAMPAGTRASMPPRRVVLMPAFKMLLAGLRAGQLQLLRAAHRPAAHHLIGHFGVELQRQSLVAIAIGLGGEIVAARGDQLRAVRQIEPVAMPLIDLSRKRRGAKLVRAGFRRQRKIADLAAPVGKAENPCAERFGEHLRAKANAEQGLVLA